MMIEDLHIPGRPGDWIQGAACRGENPDIFFPRRGESPRPAMAICARCDVRSECLDYALDECIRVGVWGGTAEMERRRLRAGRKARAAMAMVGRRRTA